MLFLSLSFFADLSQAKKPTAGKESGAAGGSYRDVGKSWVLVGNEMSIRDFYSSPWPTL